MELHIGLGRSARIRRLDVWWPASDANQGFTNVPARQFIEIREFAAAYTTLERRPVKLGGTNGKKGG